jgi:glutamine amidotransferase-like uncharacterized protein
MRAAQTPPATQPSLLRVAIYDDAGGSGAGPRNISSCLQPQPETFSSQRITADDIRAGALKNFDVLVQPGGGASNQAAALGTQGRQAIRDFVHAGGGYVGICAGAYLATTNYPWSLHILNAKVLDSRHWARGTGKVQIKLSNDGQNLLGASSQIVNIYYGQGPLLAPDTTPGLPAYETLASYKTEIARNGAPRGIMKGATAIAAAPYGQGRVLCISPHPEKSTPLHTFIRHAILWAGANSAGNSAPTTQPAAASPAAQSGAADAQ